MNIAEKTEEKAKKVSNRGYKIPENSKSADYIQEAAQWMVKVREIHDQLIEESLSDLTPRVTRLIVKANTAAMNASQWLEKTGVTETNPPSIENERK